MLPPILFNLPREGAVDLGRGQGKINLSFRSYTNQGLIALPPRNGQNELVWEKSKNRTSVRQSLTLLTRRLQAWIQVGIPFSVIGATQAEQQAASVRLRMTLDNLNKKVLEVHQSYCFPVRFILVNFFNGYLPTPLRGNLRIVNDVVTNGPQYQEDYELRYADTSFSHNAVLAKGDERMQKSTLFPFTSLMIVSKPARRMYDLGGEHYGFTSCLGRINCLKSGFFTLQLPCIAYSDLNRYWLDFQWQNRCVMVLDICIGAVAILAITILNFVKCMLGVIVSPGVNFAPYPLDYNPNLSPFDLGERNAIQYAGVV